MSISDAQLQSEIQKQLRESQNKFVYYILALNIASIGFSLSRTMDQMLNDTHIPLGLAIVLWGLSIYCAFSFVKVFQSGLMANNAYFDVIRGNVKDIEPSDRVKETAKEVTAIEGDKISARSSKNYRWMQYFFYLGIVSFVVWQLIHMSQN